MSKSTENQRVTGKYLSPALEFLEIKINDVCVAGSTENPLDKWEERDPISGEI